MHFYGDWQRCSHVYGAVGVSLSGVHFVVIFAAVDCRFLCHFAQYIVCCKLILITVSDCINESGSGLSNRLKTKLSSCFCFIKVTTNKCSVCLILRSGQVR